MCWGGHSFAGDSKGSHGCAPTWSKGDQQGAKPQVEGKGGHGGADTGDRHKAWGRDRDVTGGQQGVRSQNPVSQLNALGKRKSAGVLCRGWSGWIPTVMAETGCREGKHPVERELGHRARTGGDPELSYQCVTLGKLPRLPKASMSPSGKD